jgi:hypothetical protein
VEELPLPTKEDQIATGSKDWICMNVTNFIVGISREICNADACKLDLKSHYVLSRDNHHYFSVFFYHPKSELPLDGGNANVKYKLKKVYHIQGDNAPTDCRHC